MPFHSVIFKCLSFPFRFVQGQNVTVPFPFGTSRTVYTPTADCSARAFWKEGPTIRGVKSLGSCGVIIYWPGSFSVSSGREITVL